MWPRVIKGMAVTGFGTSLLVHVLTFFGIDLVPSFTVISILHGGAIVAFISMIVGIRRHSVRYFVRAVKQTPGWAGAGMGVLFVYVCISLSWCLSVFDAAPSAIRTLYGIRVFSAGWMMFYFIPSVYFAFMEAEMRGNSEHAT